MLEQQGRTWLVPFSTDLDNPAVNGEVREVIGVEGRHIAQSFEDFADFKIALDIKAAGASGEFVFHPVNGFGDEKGPVVVAGVPWSSGVSDAEFDLAKSAISDRLGEERQMNVANSMAMSARGQGL